MYNLPIVKKFLTNKNITYVLLILIGTIILFKPPTDPDFGWHYKYGEYIFQNRRVLRENIFSYTNTDYQWANSYWLSQLIMYISVYYLGTSGLSLVLSLILSLITLKIFKKNNVNLTAVSITFIFIASVLTVFMVTVRPLYFSTLFMFILIHTLVEKKRSIKYLPFIFLLWANMHADFVIGLFVLGSYLLFHFFEKTGFPETDSKIIINFWKKRKELSSYLKKVKKYFLKILKDGKSRSLIVKNFSVLIFCFLATFVNPYGAKLWGTLLKEITQPIKSFVAEWGPMGEINIEFIFLAFFLAIGLLSGISSKNISEGKYSFWYRFLIVFFYILSLKSVYFIRIFIILSSFSILDRTNILKKDVLKAIPEATKRPLRYILNPFLLFLFISIIPNLLFVLKTSCNVSLWSKLKSYPYEAVSYIRRNNIEGRMINDYSWGGYLIWQLPDYKTFIDGRMAAWRTEDGYFMKDYQKIYYGTEKNGELLEKYLNQYDIKWALLKPEEKITDYLKEDKEWDVAFENEISIILVKN
jgi:hypothetical protein